MAPRDRAVAVTINNEGDEELVLQGDVYVWKQKPNGEDDLILTEDIILSPPIVKVAPKSRQILRLARVRIAPTPLELTYRLVVREIPEAKSVAGKDMMLQFALAFSMPVFISPPNAKRQLDCKVARSTANSVNAFCQNTGDTYVQVREIAVLNGAGEKIAIRDSGGYLLPGITRSFEVKTPEGRIPGGKAKLLATLDTGPNLSFEVVVPD